eukprot:1140728-Pelagomonas_calceolata.AAC.4
MEIGIISAGHPHARVTLVAHYTSKNYMYPCGGLGLQGMMSCKTNKQVLKTWLPGSQCDAPCLSCAEFGREKMDLGTLTSYPVLQDFSCSELV